MWETIQTVAMQYSVPNWVYMIVTLIFCIKEIMAQALIWILERKLGKYE